MSLKCTECNREFSLKSNLTRHYRMVHNIEVERMDILPADFDVYHYKCLEGCNISFRYNRELRNHLRTKHEIDIVVLNLEFPNSEEFNKWLHNEETNNCVQYIHLTATKRKSTGGETFYYECSRTGKRNYLDDKIRKRKARKWTTKLNRGCTSQIIVNKSHDGSYSIIYYKSHYGHEIDLEHIKLSKQDRGAIASKLLLGLPISSVLHSVKNTNGNLKRINLLDRKDVFNIRKSFNIDLRDGKLVNIDAININSFLMECGSLEYNPILYYSIQDFPECDDIYFIIMSKYQADMLEEHGGDTIMINSTFLKNCDFELISLFIIGKSESFPAACMFTNKTDQVVYELFLNKIKDKIGTITPTTLITNCNEMYCQAWKNVMGEIDNNIYNPIQVDLDWKLNLNRICCSESDVTKIKRNWVYDTLKIIQSYDEETEFIDNLEATIKVLKTDSDLNDFLNYFVQVYRNPKKWANCYKNNNNVMAKQLQVISDVLKQYLNEENEIRFDKIFHSLIRYIRDETVNSMLKNKTNLIVFINQNDSRHISLSDKNLQGTHLSEDMWNVSDEDIGTVYVIQKFLERKCCNLTCSTCHICIHCFSCTCVDFFVSNAICVHIHYIWVTYFHCIIQNGSGESDEENWGEEIIIEVIEEQEQDTKKEETTQLLQDEIIQRISILSSNICNIQSEDTLKVILDTVTQLCNLCNTENQIIEENPKDKVFLTDHSYL